MKSLTTLLFCLLLANPSHAIVLLFGPEFAVSNDEMLNCQRPLTREDTDMAIYRSGFCDNPEIKKHHALLYELWQSKYVAHAELGREFLIENQELSNEDRYLFVSPDDDYGVWLGVDQAILELGTTPMTVQAFEKHKDQLQQMIFNDPAELGMKPQTFTGGGHINIGLEAFRHNRVLLVNFLIDFYNHSELSLGAFGFDTNNALNLRMTHQRKIHEMAAKLQRLLMQKDRKYEYFLQGVEEALGPYSTDKFINHWRDVPRGMLMMRRGDFAIILRNNTGKMSGYRIEIRAVRPQVSMDQWIRMIRLLQARVNYLEQFEDMIKLVPQPFEIRNTGTIESLVKNPPVNPQDALENFYQYVVESGESWLDHQDYLWPQWHIDSEIINFNNDKIANCEDFLK